MERVLWMTDTYGDRNGVSTVLQAIHHEICERELPVDLVICSHTMKSGPHLVVLRPVSEFTLPLYRQQPVRIPNFMALHRLVRRGNYSRIICSTEGPMGWAARWLKARLPVEVAFFLHTDWLTFAKEVLHFEETGLKRLQRILRVYYRGFHRVFVLNTEQRDWLTGSEIGLDPSKVSLTAHWVDKGFSGNSAEAPWPWSFDPALPVLLYAGRLSREKGVFELPGIIAMVGEYFPEVKLVIAGTGPAEAELKKLMPEAHFMGWVDHDILPQLLASADLMILPSRFDTFSCAVLEALSCGCPVVAYDTKGPRDIIGNGVTGYLATDRQEMAGRIIGHFLAPEGHEAMRQAAVARAEEYNATSIMDRLLADLGVYPQPVCA